MSGQPVVVCRDCLTSVCLNHRLLQRSILMPTRSRLVPLNRLARVSVLVSALCGGIPASPALASGVVAVTASGSAAEDGAPSLSATHQGADTPGAEAARPEVRVRWGVSAASHVYREPNMRIAGVGLGLRGETYAEAFQQPLAIEGEVIAGLSNYTSPVSGDIDGLRRIGTMLHLQSARLAGDAWVPRPGLMMTTEWTDLRGVSTLGKAGYERFNLSVWLSGTWDIERERGSGATRLRAALLLQGRQVSLLSQTGLGFRDVTNIQRRGLMASIETPFQIEDRHASLRLSIKAVGRSDLVQASATSYAYEPVNRAAELTFTLWW